MHRALFALCLLASTAAIAADPTPLALSHHGYLLNAQDVPISENTAITFGLYDDPDLSDAPTPIWGETYDVQVKGGQYAVLLGDTRGPNAAKKPMPPSVFGASERWLGIKVGTGAELTPRLRVAAVPYAGRAASAASIDADTIGTDQLKAKAVTLAKLDLTGGKFVGLDADTLDGLDATAFAPAAIETKIDAIKAATDLLAGEGGIRASTDLLGGMKTTADAIKATTDAIKASTDSLAAIKASTDTLAAVKASTDNLAAIKASTDTLAAVKSSTDNIASIKAATDTLAALTTKLETIGKNSGGAYTATCADGSGADGWSVNGWASRAACLDDGRFHKVLVWRHEGASNGKISFGSLADAARFGAGAHVRVRPGDNDGLFEVAQWGVRGSIFAARTNRIFDANDVWLRLDTGASSSYIGGCHWPATTPTWSGWNDDLLFGWADRGDIAAYCDEYTNGHVQMAGDVEVWMSR